MLKGKVALVTGSTSGIGMGIAKRLAAAGCNVMINGFGDKAEIEKARLSIESEFSVKAAYSDADISKPDKVEKMISDAIKTFSKLDILVNNAGIQFVAPTEEFPLDKWDAVLATNLSSAFYAAKYALPGMQKNQFGRIINIASAHGKVASKNKSAYVAAKHGMVGLTKVIALENANNNITCNAICPGWVLTPLVQKQIDERAAKEGIEVKKAEEELLSEKQPMLKFSSPENIGDLVVFLSGESARTITGTAISIDGGWTAQ